MKTSKQRSIQILLYLKAAIWIYLGIMYFSYVGSPNAFVPLWAVIGLFIANALISIFLAWKFTTGKLIYYYAIFFFILMNILLTITDQFGLWDAVSLIIDIGIIGLLLTSRVIVKSK